MMPETYDGFDETVRKAAFEDFVSNIASIREVWQRAVLSRDAKRDYDKECGYPETPTAEDYEHLYRTEPIAAKVVELLPKHCWRVSPEVRETETGDEETEFERDVKRMGKDLAGGSLLVQQYGSAVNHWLRKLDILSGIGRYGVLLYGFDDGKALSEPVTPRKGARLLYLRCFPEHLATVSTTEKDPSNPRFGQPTSYSVKFDDPTAADSGYDVGTQEVHWTRVLHFADVDHTAASSEMYAIPRQEPVRKRLLDLNKLYGGSAEMYWRGAFPGISIESTDGRKVSNVAALRKMIDAYQNSLQRYLALEGMTANSLAPQVVDPGPQIDVQIHAIAMKQQCPVRVFMGSERGELASSQDKGDWNNTVAERQRSLLTPRMLDPFYTRLIWAGVLSAPKQWYCTWPPLDQVSAKEKADVAMVLTNVLAMYVSQGADALVPPMDFLTRVVGWSQEEAEAVIQAAENANEGDGQIGGKLFKTVGGVYAMTELFDAFQDRKFTETTMRELLQKFFGLDEQQTDRVIADTKQGTVVQDPLDQGRMPSGADIGSQKPRKAQFTDASSHDKANK